MPKSNPYDPKYIMERDHITYEQALAVIEKMKEKNAWNKGKKITKSNPYDPSYVMMRDQCSLEEAQQKILEFKSKKATSLENFIKKYGAELGKQKYDDWKEKSLAKGHDVAKKNGRSQSKFSPAYYMRHGYSIDESIKMALDYQHENSPLHIQYYIKRGLGIEYAKKKIRSIHDKKIGKDVFLEYLEKVKGLTTDQARAVVKKSRGHFTKENLGFEEFEKRKRKIRESLESRGYWVPLEDMSDYQVYRKKVWDFTNQNDLSLLENYDKRGLAGEIGAYHLDHKFSISRGYIEGVLPELIGSLKNLEFIPWEQNVKKQGNCSITLESLKNEN